MQTANSENQTGSNDNSFVSKVILPNGVPLENGLNMKNAHGASYTTAMAAADASYIKKNYCNDLSTESFKSRAGESFKSIVSGVTLDKYNACVRAKSYGLYCDASANGDAVTATVRWEPSELVRDVLPRVALDWAGMSNLKTVNTLPEKLGIGSGYVVTFAREDVNAGSVFALTASDHGKSVNFACKVEIPGAPPVVEVPKKIKKTGRFPVCGVESYALGQSVVCGVASYVTTRAAVCGVELYRSGRNPVCGVESYNERHDCDICGQAGPFGGCRQCSNPSFGVNQYKDCRNAANGPELFAECSSEANGVAAYNSCRHPSFGIDQYKECEIEVDP